MSQSNKQRQTNILTELFDKGNVTVKELALSMAVSAATIRRDLRTLADKKQLELVHGGAIIPETTDFSFRSKAMRNVPAKRVIGRLAAGLIENNEHVLLDSGTTCFEMVHHLKSKQGLSVIANSVPLTVELGGSPHINVFTLGGNYRPDRMDTVGHLAMSALEQLRGYTAFIGTDGVSMDFGISASDVESAHLFRLAIKNARSTTLLIDHGKFMTPSLFKIVEWEMISKLVTDQEPSAEWREFLAEREIEIIMP